MPRRKACTAYGCNEKTSGGLPFCRACFKTLNSTIRRELIQAYRVGGYRAVQLADQARDLFLKRKDIPTMTSGKSNIVDVSVAIRSDDPDKGAIAVYDGTDDDNGREVWIWLPRSQIEYQETTEGVIEIQLPEWLAKDKGLI